MAALAVFQIHRLAYEFVAFASGQCPTAIALLVQLGWIDVIFIVSLFSG